MSKAEILGELPKLGRGERREILERICEIEDEDLLKGGQPADDEKAMLDRELREYEKNPQAGAPWKEVEARLRQQVPQ